MPIITVAFPFLKLVGCFTWCYFSTNKIEETIVFCFGCVAVESAAVESAAVEKKAVYLLWLEEKAFFSTELRFLRTEALKLMKANGWTKALHYKSKIGVRSSVES